MPAHPPTPTRTHPPTHTFCHTQAHQLADRPTFYHPPHPQLAPELLSLFTRALRFPEDAPQQAQHAGRAGAGAAEPAAPSVSGACVCVCAYACACACVCVRARARLRACGGTGALE